MAECPKQSGKCEDPCGSGNAFEDRVKDLLTEAFPSLQIEKPRPVKRIPTICSDHDHDMPHSKKGQPDYVIKLPDGSLVVGEAKHYHGNLPDDRKTLDKLLSDVESMKADGQNISGAFLVVSDKTNVSDSLHQVAQDHKVKVIKVDAFDKSRLDSDLSACRGLMSVYTNQTGEQVCKVSWDIGNGDEAVDMTKCKGTSAITSTESKVSNHSPVDAKFGDGHGWQREEGAIFDKVTEGPVMWNKSTEEMFFKESASSSIKLNPQAVKQLQEAFMSAASYSATVEASKNSGNLDAGLKEIGESAARVVQDGSKACAIKSVERVLIANNILGENNAKFVAEAAIKCVCASGEHGACDFQSSLQRMVEDPTTASVSVFNKLMQLSGKNVALQWNGNPLDGGYLGLQVSGKGFGLGTKTQIGADGFVSDAGIHASCRIPQTLNAVGVRRCLGASTENYKHFTPLSHKSGVHVKSVSSKLYGAKVDMDVLGVDLAQARVGAVRRQELQQTQWQTAAGSVEQHTVGKSFEGIGADVRIGLPRTKLSGDAFSASFGAGKSTDFEHRRSCGWITDSETYNLTNKYGLETSVGMFGKKCSLSTTFLEERASKQRYRVCVGALDLVHHSKECHTLSSKYVPGSLLYYQSLQSSNVLGFNASHSLQWSFLSGEAKDRCSYGVGGLSLIETERTGKASGVDVETNRAKFKAGQPKCQVRFGEDAVAIGQAAAGEANLRANLVAAKNEHNLDAGWKDIEDGLWSCARDAGVAGGVHALERILVKKQILEPGLASSVAQFTMTYYRLMKEHGTSSPGALYEKLAAESQKFVQDMANDPTKGSVFVFNKLMSKFGYNVALQWNGNPVKGGYLGIMVDGRAVGIGTKLQHGVYGSVEDTGIHASFRPKQTLGIVGASATVGRSVEVYQKDTRSLTSDLTGAKCGIDVLGVDIARARVGYLNEREIVQTDTYKSVRGFQGLAGDLRVGLPDSMTSGESLRAFVGVGESTKQVAVVNADQSLSNINWKDNGMHASVSAYGTGFNVVAGKAFRENRLAWESDEKHRIEQWTKETLHGVDLRFNSRDNEISRFHTGHVAVEKGQTNYMLVGGDLSEVSSKHTNICVEEHNKLCGFALDEPRQTLEKNTGDRSLSSCGVSIRTDKFEHKQGQFDHIGDVETEMSSTLMKSKVTGCGIYDEVAQTVDFRGVQQHSLKVGDKELRFQKDDADRLRKAALAHYHEKNIMVNDSRQEMVQNVESVLKEADLASDSLHDRLFRKRSTAAAQKEFAHELYSKIHEMSQNAKGVEMFNTVAAKLGTDDASKWTQQGNQQKLLENMGVSAKDANAFASRGVESSYEVAAQSNVREVGHGRLHSQSKEGSVAAGGYEVVSSRDIDGVHEHTQLDDYNLSKQSICHGRSTDTMMKLQSSTEGSYKTWSHHDESTSVTQRTEVVGVIRTISVLGKAVKDLSTGFVKQVEHTDCHSYNREGFAAQDKEVHIAQTSKGNLRDGKRMDMVVSTAGSQINSDSVGGLIDYSTSKIMLQENGSACQVSEGIFLKKTSQGSGTFNKEANEIIFKEGSSSLYLSSHACQGIAGALGSALSVYLKKGKVEYREICKEACWEIAKGGGKALFMSVLTQSCERRMSGGGSMAFAAVSFASASVAILRNKNLSWKQCGKETAWEGSKALVVMGALKLASKSMCVSAASVIVPVVQLSFEAVRSIHLYFNGEITWARLQSNLVHAGVQIVATGSGGALAGMALGAATGGPLGACIGMVLGGILGSFGASKLTSNMKDIGDFAERHGWCSFADFLRRMAQLPEDERLERAYSFLGMHAGKGTEALRPKHGSYEHISDEEVNHLYRQASKRLHPDRFQDAKEKRKAEEKFKELQTYLTLIKAAREKERKQKTYQEHGFGEGHIYAELELKTDDQVRSASAAMPAEKLRALLAYLADFHCEVQLTRLSELEMKERDGLRDNAQVFLSLHDSSSIANVRASVVRCLLWARGRDDVVLEKMTIRAFEYLCDTTRVKQRGVGRELALSTQIVRSCNFGADEAAARDDPKPALIEARVRTAQALRDTQADINNLEIQAASWSELWKQGAYPENAHEAVFQNVEQILWEAFSDSAIPQRWSVEAYQEVLSRCQGKLGAAIFLPENETPSAISIPREEKKWLVALAAATDGKRLHALLRKTVLTPLHAVASSAMYQKAADIISLSCLADRFAETVSGISSATASFSYEAIESWRCCASGHSRLQLALAMPSDTIMEATHEYDSQASTWLLHDIASVFERAAASLGVQITGDETAADLKQVMRRILRQYNICLLCLDERVSDWAMVDRPSASARLQIAASSFKCAQMCCSVLCPTATSHVDVPFLRATLFKADSDMIAMNPTSLLVAPKVNANALQIVASVLAEHSQILCESFVQSQLPHQALIDGVRAVAKLYNNRARCWRADVELLVPTSETQWLISLAAASDPCSLYEVLRNCLLSTIVILGASYVSGNSVHSSFVADLSRQCDAAAADICGLHHEELPYSYEGDKSLNFQVADLKMGDRVTRRGEPATVVAIDRTIEPPGIVLRMDTTGAEAGTEPHLLRAPRSTDKEHFASVSKKIVNSWVHWGLDLVLRIQPAKIDMTDMSPLMYGRALLGNTILFNAIEDSLLAALLWAIHIEGRGTRSTFAEKALKVLATCKLAHEALKRANTDSDDDAVSVIVDKLCSCRQHFASLMAEQQVILPTPDDENCIFSELTKYFHIVCKEHWAKLFVSGLQQADLVLFVKSHANFPDIGGPLPRGVAYTVDSLLFDNRMHLLVALAAILDARRLHDHVCQHLATPLHIMVTAMLEDDVHRLAFSQLCDEAVSRSTGEDVHPHASYYMLEMKFNCIRPSTDDILPWERFYMRAHKDQILLMEGMHAQDAAKILSRRSATKVPDGNFYIQAYLLLHTQAPPSIQSSLVVDGEFSSNPCQSDSSCFLHTMFMTLQLAQHITLYPFKSRCKGKASEWRSLLTALIRFSTSPPALQQEAFDKISKFSIGSIASELAAGLKALSPQVVSCPNLNIITELLSNRLPRNEVLSSSAVEGWSELQWQVALTAAQDPELLHALLWKNLLNPLHLEITGRTGRSEGQCRDALSSLVSSQLDHMAWQVTGIETVSTRKFTFSTFNTRKFMIALVVRVCSCGFCKSSVQ